MIDIQSDSLSMLQKSCEVMNIYTSRKALLGWRCSRCHTPVSAICLPQVRDNNGEMYRVTPAQHADVTCQAQLVWPTGAAGQCRLFLVCSDS